MLKSFDSAGSKLPIEMNESETSQGHLDLMSEVSSPDVFSKYAK